MALVTPPPVDRQVPQPGHAAHRRRLLEHRVLRLGQLADLDRAALGGRGGGAGAGRALHIAATTALREVDAALARLAAGTYGVCVSCRTPITEDRLEAEPMAPLCRRCHVNEQNCGISYRW